MSERREHTEGHTVAQLLAQVCRVTGDRVRRHMRTIGLHRGQGFALFHLWHHDGVPQNEISRAMHIRPASVTNMLQRMERDGWIERRRDPDDQRVVRVFLTAKAREIRAEAGGVFRDVDREISEIFTQEELATFEALLQKLHDRFITHRAHGGAHKAHFHVEKEDV